MASDLTALRSALASSAAALMPPKPAAIALISMVKCTCSNWPRTLADAREPKGLFDVSAKKRLGHGGHSFARNRHARQRSEPYSSRPARRPRNRYADSSRCGARWIKGSRSPAHRSGLRTDTRQPGSPHHARTFHTATAPSAGVILLREAIPISIAIEELVLIWNASEAEEWIGRLVWIPL
jgi:hypothetical protein